MGFATRSLVRIQKGYSVRVFEKNTVISGFWTLFTILVLSGCAEFKEAWMWLDGYHTKTCDESRYVGTRVQNLSSQEVTFHLCSPDVESPVIIRSLKPGTEVMEFQTVIEQKIGEQTFDRAESCETKGLVPDKIGEQVPFLSDGSSGDLQICLNPKYPVPYNRPWISPTIDVRVFFIVPISRPCPENSSLFDPSTTTCL